MIRILQGFVNDQFGGVSQYIFKNYQYIDKKTIQYDFLYLNEKPFFYEECVRIGARFYRLPRIRHFIPYLKTFYKLIKESDYQAVYFNLSFAHIIPIFVAKYAGAKIIILHAHSTYIDASNPLKRLLTKIYHQISLLCLNFVKIDYFFACSNEAGEFVFGKSINKKSNYKVWNNAIETERFKYDANEAAAIRKSLDIGENVFVIGHVGRFSYQKNHEFLIRVFEKIHRVKPNSILLLVGKGENEKKIKGMVNELGIATAVRFLGSRNDVNKLMQAMDCFILPSRFEGLPIVGIEAQAAGLPCFFSDVITQESKITNLAHFISLDSSPEKWAEKILSIIPVKRKDMSKEVAQAGYDINEQIKHIESFFVSLHG